MPAPLRPLHTEALRRNPGEPEFHQAPGEVLPDPGPLLTARPELLSSASTGASPTAGKPGVLTGEGTGRGGSPVRAEATGHGTPGDYVPGANAAGFERVADAMPAQGVI